MASTIHKIAIKLATDGPVKVLPTQRKVQLLFGGVFVVRTTSAVYVWEHPYYPQFYIPKKDLLEISNTKSAQLKEGPKITSEAGNHIATQYTLSVGSTKSTDQIVAFTDTLEGKAEPLRDLVKIDFEAVDQWFEEDMPIYIHPKDPFKRIDILPSTRHVKVSVDGHTIAETRFAMHLYETGLPTRYYLPRVAVDPTVLRPSDMGTGCPYKGDSQYYHVEIEGKVYENLFWYYKHPTPESAKVEGLLCPYNERCDIEVDGVKLERPNTHFGKAKVGTKPSIV